MKKIVFIMQQLTLGGAEKAVISLANGLTEKRDYEIILFVFLQSKPIIPISPEIKIVFLSSIELKRENLLRKILRKEIELKTVRKLSKTFEDTIIISTRNEYSVILSRNAKKNNFIIAQLHNDYSKKDMNNFINHFDNVGAFVQLNDTFRKEIETAIRLKNKHTILPVIPNFIEAKPELNNIKKENIVISVGRFLHVKGFDRLVEIWKMVCKTTKDWKLIIIGDGEDFNYIKQLIKKDKLEDYIELTGNLSNDKVFEYMARSKIYALSSYSEAFPLVTLEAMQAALPIVTFDVRTGPKHIVKEGETGFVVEDGKLDIFADKIKYLIENPDLLKTFSRNALLRSKEFEKDSVLNKWYDLIDKIPNNY